MVVDIIKNKAIIPVKERSLFLSPNRLQVKNSSPVIPFASVDKFIHAILNDGDVEMDVYKAVDTAAPAILAAASSDEGGTMKLVPDFREERR